MTKKTTATGFSWKIENSMGWSEVKEWCRHQPVKYRYPAPKDEAKPHGLRDPVQPGEEHWIRSKKEVKAKENTRYPTTVQNSVTNRMAAAP
jgi:hypothetical protein